MTNSLVVGRLILAAVFAAAAIGKLRDLAGSRQAMTSFGLSGSSARFAGPALPWAELAVAAALVVSSSAWPAAVGALALLLVFIVAISVNLLRGRAPECHCFGQLHSEPIGAPVLIRNGVLAAIALFVVSAGWSDPGPSVTAWVTTLTAGEQFSVTVAAAAIAIVAVQTARLSQLRLQNDRLVSSLEQAQDGTNAAGAPVAPPTTGDAGALLPGDAAPLFGLPNLDGTSVTLEALCAERKAVVLFFSDPRCGPCAALMPLVAEWNRQYRDLLTFVIITRGDPEVNRSKLDSHEFAHVLLQSDREIASAFGALWTPTAVLVHQDGRIGSGVAQGEVEITKLVKSAVADASARAVSPSGDAGAAGAGSQDPHDFTLPDLDGREIRLSSFRGKPSLVLFWNPGCGYCGRMLGDLKVWEQQPVNERPQLIVVSAGDAEVVRALGLISTVVLDGNLDVMQRQFRALGTPSAVLLDRNGRQVGGVAVGAANVFSVAAAAVAVAAFPAEARPLRDECVQDELLSDGSMVLYSGCRNRVMTLNGTGALIWECCDGLLDVDGIVGELRDVFPSAPASHVQSLLDDLFQAGMIARAPSAETVSSPGSMATIH